MQEIIDEKLKEVKIVEVKEDPSYSGSKVFVTVELPLSGPSVDLEQFFQLDSMKQLAIKEASKAINRSAGWSNVGPIRFFKEGEVIDSHYGDRKGADSVRVTYVCLGAL